MKTFFWNTRQFTAQLLRQPPIDCHARTKKSAFCGKCEPGHTFECDSCKRQVSWCNGGFENDLCDNCHASYYREDQQLLEIEY